MDVSGRNAMQLKKVMWKDVVETECDGPCSHFLVCLLLFANSALIILVLVFLSYLSMFVSFFFLVPAYYIYVFFPL